VNSLSKRYAMTGWRLGYCAGPAALIRAAYLVLQQSSRGPATFVQDAGVAALGGPQECVEATRCGCAARCGRVCEALAGRAGGGKAGGRLGAAALRCGRPFQGELSWYPCFRGFAPLATCCGPYGAGWMRRRISWPHFRQQWARAYRHSLPPVQGAGVALLA